MSEEQEPSVADEESSGTLDEDTEVKEEVSGESEEASEAHEAAEEDAGTSKEAWFVPGQFRTSEDMKKSYYSLVPEYTRSRQELQRLKAQAAQPVKDPTHEINEFAEAVKRNPVEAVRNVARTVAEEAKEEVRKARFEMEYNRHLQNDEFRELEPVMTHIANTYTDLIEENKLYNNPRLLPLLFYAARGVKQEELSKNAERRGVQRGERMAIKKSKAQTEGASGSKGHVKRKFNYELTLEEMEKELRRGNL